MQVCVGGDTRCLHYMPGYIQDVVGALLCLPLRQGFPSAAYMLFNLCLWFLSLFLLVPPRKQTLAVVFTMLLTHPGKVSGCMALYGVPQWAEFCALCCTTVELLLHGYSALFLWPAMRQGSCLFSYAAFRMVMLDPRNDNSERADVDTELCVYHCKVLCQVTKLD